MRIVDRKNHLQGGPAIVHVAEGLAVFLIRDCDDFNVVQGLPDDIESVDADLFQTGVFDSMTLVEFILHLEERFELRFPMEDLELDSVLSVTRLAEMVRNGKRAAAGDRF